MQYRIFEKGKLLDENGHLVERGYATKLLRIYNRADIKAPWHRIKEWDYYYIGNEEVGVGLTIADNSYMSLVGATLLDFNRPWTRTTNEIKWLSRGSIGLPSASNQGDIKYDSKRVKMHFLNDGTKRCIQCEFANFERGKDLIVDAVLTDEPEDSMVIVTPFQGKPTHFYYNQKINCMHAEGKLSYDGTTTEFAPHDSFAVLDWGRGVWPYRNTWYWGSASGIVLGKDFGFNFGYGFGDTREAGENMLFYDGKAHKLGDVFFDIPKTNRGLYYMAKWKIYSSDSRVSLVFKPIIDRYANTNALLLSSNTHQVFGKFSGTVILDDGLLLEIDNLLGFAERVKNKW